MVRAPHKARWWEKRAPVQFAFRYRASLTLRMVAEGLRAPALDRISRKTTASRHRKLSKFGGKPASALAFEACKPVYLSDYRLGR
jgi:hypothetical protein